MVARCFKFLTGVPLKARTYTHKKKDFIYLKRALTLHTPKTENIGLASCH
jgi:hypothetical protein